MTDGRLSSRTRFQIVVSGDLQSGGEVVTPFGGAAALFGGMGLLRARASWGATNTAPEVADLRFRVGGILAVPFPRPRTRAEVRKHPEYYALREELIGFLEEHAVSKAG